MAFAMAFDGPAPSPEDPMAHGVREGEGHGPWKAPTPWFAPAHELRRLMACDGPLFSQTELTCKAVTKLLSETKFGCLVFQVQWDETKYGVIPFGEPAGRGTEVSTFAAHGRVIWGRARSSGRS